MKSFLPNWRRRREYPFQDVPLRRGKGQGCNHQSTMPKMMEKKKSLENLRSLRKPLMQPIQSFLLKPIHLTHLLSPPESSLNKVAKSKDGKDGFVCSHDTNVDSHGETNGDKKGEPEGQAIDDMPPLEDETEVWRLESEVKMPKMPKMSSKFIFKMYL